MNALKLTLSWLWRLVVAGAAHAVGIVIGGAVAVALGLRLAASPAPMDPTTGALLLLPGGLAIALGLAAMASGLAGGRRRRWAILAAFAFVVEGVGTAIESAFFTTLGGGLSSALINLPASLLCALAVVLLFPAPAAAPAGAVRAFFTRWPAGKLAGRLLLALVAFPLFYLLFGMIIAPIVTPYYRQLDFLSIPPMTTLLAVVHLRSALFLAVSLPVVLYWRHSRARLALALGLGHFTAVGLSGLLQATFFPAVMRWTHGVEILADSLCYGLALAWLFYAPPTAPPATVTRGGDDPPTRSGARRTAILAAKLLGLTFVLMTISGVGAALFLGGSETGGAVPPPEESGSLPAVAFFVLLLQTIALAYPVARSRWGGWRLIGTVALVYFGSASFLGLVETIVYPAATLGGMLSGVMGMAAFSAIVFAPILVWTLGKGRAPRADSAGAGRPPSHSAAGWTWRVAAGGAIFLAFYYLFGYFVAWKQPAVREFYGGTDPGSFLAQMRSVVRGAPWMVPFQYLRGLLWVLLALPIVRMMRARRWEIGLALSLLFGVPAVYLLFPNPVMPEAVRMAHLVETLPYQLLFGWALAWLLVPPAASAAGEREGGDVAPGRLGERHGAAAR